MGPKAQNQDSPCCNVVCAFCIFSIDCPTKKRVGIRPPLIDKLSSIPIPQDGAIAPEGFVLLAIVDPFINKRINYQYNDRLLI
jgi:hypothetical protein